MTDKKDIELIGEYEELVVLLRQLHKDTPILEKQHQSINKAFVNAQEKLETTIASSGIEIESIKNNILHDFSNECKAIVSELLSSSHNQTVELLSKIQMEKKNLEKISAECVNSTQKLMKTIEEAKAVLHALNSQPREKATSSITSEPSKKYIQFNYGEILNGAEMWEKYHGKTATPIIVQAPTWTGDYCYVITEYDKAKNQVKGRVYLDGKPRSTKGYPDGKRTFTAKTEFTPYRSPNEKSIIENELGMIIDRLG